MSERKEENQRTIQKGAIKSGLRQFPVSTSTESSAFLSLIDTSYNYNSKSEGENKVISRFITIENRRAKNVDSMLAKKKTKEKGGKREREREC